MTLEQLLKRVKLTIDYAKHANESDIVDYLVNLDEDDRQYLKESLDDIDEMLLHEKR